MRVLLGNCKCSTSGSMPSVSSQVLFDLIKRALRVIAIQNAVAQYLQLRRSPRSQRKSSRPWRRSDSLICPQPDLPLLRLWRRTTSGPLWGPTASSIIMKGLLPSRIARNHAPSPWSRSIAPVGIGPFICSCINISKKLGIVIESDKIETLCRARAYRYSPPAIRHCLW